MPRSMERFTSSFFFFFLLLLLIFNVVSSFSGESADSGDVDGGSNSKGKRWAILVAGSKGYWNYRHQADVCHAYQILKKGGLKDENIVVFMYDDIANNPRNPRPGTIVNHPNGPDVYAGVPKDYVGEDVTVSNFLAVLLGNRTAVSGGSGKVVDSGPDDRIFVFYSDHGGPGVLAFPTNPMLFASDLNAALKQKHASGSYKSMVIYLEACDGGSMFHGLLIGDINAYATTAAGPKEDSYAAYCPGHADNAASPEFGTCLGDLYSISWLEDSEISDLRVETLRKQYGLVKQRTNTSHVMQYGELRLNHGRLSSYLGSSSSTSGHLHDPEAALPPSLHLLSQWDADLFYFTNKLRGCEEGSEEWEEARREVFDVMSHRAHVDRSVERFGRQLLLFVAAAEALEVLDGARAAGEALVDDWSCLKSLVRAYEEHCGSLSGYGMKHMRRLANICNAGRMNGAAAAAAAACPEFPSNPWSSLRKGLSA